MILKVQGIFANRWVKLEYRIDEKVLEKLLENDESLSHATLEDFKLNKSYEDNLYVLKKLPKQTEVVKGGRLDILVRTDPRVLADLGDYRLEHDNLTLLERLIKVLGEVGYFPKTKDRIENIMELDDVGDALKVLRG